MRYILTGDHWNAEEAYRMGEVQRVAPDAKEALQAGIGIANRIADCGPLGIKTSLVSAHLAIDQSAKEALSKLDAQFGALFHTQDFQEGVKAEAEGRKPVYQGNRRESNDHSPGFLRFIRESGLPFRALKHFKKIGLDSPQELYLRLAKQTCSPERLASQ